MYIVQNCNPRVYVSGVEDRGRSGFGADWGQSDPRNSGGRAEGPQEELIAELTGIKRVLQRADLCQIKHVTIVCSSEDIVDLLNKRGESTFNSDAAENIINWIYYENTVYFTMEFLDSRSEEFNHSLKIARKSCGTHSEAKHLIDDSLFCDGVITVNVYGAWQTKYKCHAAVGIFFENGLQTPDGVDMNEAILIYNATNNFDVQVSALSEALNSLLYYKYREARIRTRSKHIADLINYFDENENLKDFYLQSKGLEHLEEQMSVFYTLDVEFLSGREQLVDKAERLARNKLEEYVRDGIPIVYTDGACPRNGQPGAVAGGGVFWGPEHPWNKKCRVDGTQQTNNSGEYTAVREALKTALNQNIDELIIRTDSQLLINSLTKFMDKWKRNGWITYDGYPVKNQSLLWEIDRLMGEMELVKFEKVLAHSGNEGNDGADQLAKEAAREAAHGYCRY